MAHEYALLPVHCESTPQLVPEPVPPPAPEVWHPPLVVHTLPLGQLRSSCPTFAQQMEPDGAQWLTPHWYWPEGHEPPLPPPPPAPVVWHPPLVVHTLPLGQLISSWPTDAQQMRPDGAQWLTPHWYWPDGHEPPLPPPAPEVWHWPLAVQVLPLGQYLSSWPTLAQHTEPLGVQCEVPHW